MAFLVETAYLVLKERKDPPDSKVTADHEGSQAREETRESQDCQEDEELRESRERQDLRGLRGTEVKIIINT